MCPSVRDGSVTNRFAANRKCVITVTTDGPLDTTTFYRIWRSSAAVVQLCIAQQGKAGVAYSLGKRSFKLNLENKLQRRLIVSAGRDYGEIDIEVA